MVTLLVALQIWCLAKVRTRPAGRKVILAIFFFSFSLQARNYYPAYHIGPDFSNGKVLHYGILFMKTFYFNAIISCAKEARAIE